MAFCCASGAKTCWAQFPLSLCDSLFCPSPCCRPAESDIITLNVKAIPSITGYSTNMGECVLWRSRGACQLG